MLTQTCERSPDIDVWWRDEKLTSAQHLSRVEL